MTAKELDVCLQDLGWSRTELARRSQSHVNSVSAWANGRAKVPGPVAAYVRLALAVKATAGKLLEL